MSKDKKTPETMQDLAQVKEPEAAKAETPETMQDLAKELAAIRKREAEIRAAMQAITEEKREASRATALDHQKALRRASEALREAGMIPSLGKK